MRNILAANIHRRTARRLAGVLALLAVLPAVPADAGKIVLNIMRGNPIDKPQKAQIKSNLPGRVGTNDIINLDGLNLGYDVKSDLFYVYKDIELGPKEIREFNIEINDIWVIPREETERLRKRAADLAAKLDDKKNKDLADKLKKKIEDNIGKIETSQAENSIKAGVRAVEHIRAYETGMALVKRVKTDIGYMENLVLAAGKDPGSLTSEPRTVNPVKREANLPPESYKPAIYRIVCSNASPVETRTIGVRRDLPPEIKAADVLDPGGLDVATDPATGGCYAQATNVVIGPGKTVTFVMKIRDKWNINMPRAETLRVNASNILSRVVAKGRYDWMPGSLTNLIGQLKDIEQEKGPQDLNDKFYVDYYRRQAERIDRIEQEIARIESVLRAVDRSTKLGPNVKPPTAKTTWGIIFGILGFLGIVSLLFFFRWYGRAQAEKKEDEIMRQAGRSVKEEAPPEGKNR